MAAGDGGCEAYTAIAWGVGLSHERSYIAGAESFYSLEGNMCGTATRGAVALPGSKATSRAKGSHRKLGGLVSGRQMLRERSKFCGIVRLSALAVARLMARSNLVGCSNGISAGFAPRRILSTNSAARRKKSGRLGPYDIKFPTSTYSRKAWMVGRRAASANVLMRVRLPNSSGSVQT